MRSSSSSNLNPPPRNSTKPDPKSKIVIFTRYPEPGKTKTRLIPTLGPVGAAELHRRMAEHALRQARPLVSDSVEVEIAYTGARKTKMRRWLQDVPLVPQGYGNLGKKMLRAARRALTRDADKVLIIGSDCPGITPTILGQALDALNDYDLVIGPAKDGGYYLIGLRRDIPELFTDMPWGTADVREKTLQTAFRLGAKTYLLEPLHDIDRPEDLPHWEAAFSTPP